MRRQSNKMRTLTHLYLPDASAICNMSLSCSWVTGGIRLLSYCLIFTLSGLATSIILYNELHIVTLNLNQNHPPTQYVMGIHHMFIKSMRVLKILHVKSYSLQNASQY